jgi:hypothetical protein
MSSIDQHGRPSSGSFERVRPAAPSSVIAWSALVVLFARSAAAECHRTSPCVDAEPLWQSPSAVRFTLVSATEALGSGQVGLGASFTYRLRPAVLTVPAPNREGRDVNLISHAMAWSLGARFGIGNRLELTALAAGLSQQGAGIKGVTSQSAPAITSPALQDPRIGFGYAFKPPLPQVGLKIRFEAKLPLGNAEALAGESSFVASPSFVVSARQGGLFATTELGARLRRPSDFFGLRVGSQALVAVGVGYELAGPRLSFSVEQYLLPSLIDSGKLRYLPAEWLLSSRWAPRFFGNFSVGAGLGGGLPLPSGDDGGHAGFGAPRFRALSYVRFTPPRD